MRADVHFAGGLKGSFQGTGTRLPPLEGALQHFVGPGIKRPMWHWVLHPCPRRHPQWRRCAPQCRFNAPNATLGALDAPNAALGALDAPNATLGALDAPNAALGALDAPNATLGALDAPNATLGALDAPNATLGALDAPNATLGRSGQAVGIQSGSEARTVSCCVARVSATYSTR